MKTPLLAAAIAASIFLAFVAGARMRTVQPARAAEPVPVATMPAPSPPPAPAAPHPRVWTLAELEEQAKVLAAGYAEAWDNEMRRSMLEERFASESERRSMHGDAAAFGREMPMKLERFRALSENQQRRIRKYLPHIGPEELMDCWPVLKELRKCREEIAQRKAAAR